MSPLTMRNEMTSFGSKLLTATASLLFTAVALAQSGERQTEGSQFGNKLPVEQQPVDAPSVDELLAAAMGHEDGAAEEALDALRGRDIDQNLLCLCIETMDWLVRSVPDEATGERRRRRRLALVELLAMQGDPTATVLRHAPDLVAALDDEARRRALTWLLGSGLDQRFLWVAEMRGKRCAPAFEVLADAETVSATLLEDVAAFVHHPEESRRKLAVAVLRRHGGSAAVEDARASPNPWPAPDVRASRDLSSLFDVALDVTKPWFSRVEALDSVQPIRVRHGQRPDAKLVAQLGDGVARLLPQLLDEDLAIAAATLATVQRCPPRMDADALAPYYARCHQELRPYVGDLIRQLRGQVRVLDGCDRVHLPPQLRDPWFRQVDLEDPRYVEIWREDPLYALATSWYPNDEQRARALPEQIRLFRITAGRNRELGAHLLPSAAGRRVLGELVAGFAQVEWLRDSASAGDPMQPHVGLLADQLTTRPFAPNDIFLAQLILPLTCLQWQARSEDLDRISTWIASAWQQGGRQMHWRLLPVLQAMGAGSKFAEADLVALLPDSRHRNSALVLDALLACGRGDVASAWLAKQARIPLVVDYERYRRAASNAVAERVLAKDAGGEAWQLAISWGRWLDPQDRGRILVHALSGLTADNVPQRVNRLRVDGDVDDATRRAFAEFFELRAATSSQGRFAVHVANAILPNMPRVVLGALRDGHLASEHIWSAVRPTRERANELAPLALQLLTRSSGKQPPQFGQLLGRILARSDIDADAVASLAASLSDRSRTEAVLVALGEIGARASAAVPAVGELALAGPHEHTAARTLAALGVPATQWLAQRANRSERAATRLWSGVISSDRVVTRATLAALLQLEELPESLRKSIASRPVERWGPDGQAWLLSIYLRHFEAVPIELLANAPYLPSSLFRRRAAERLATDTSDLATGVLQHLLLDRDPAVRATAETSLRGR